MDTDSGYFIAPEGWTPQSPNPFSDDGSYAGWSCFVIEDDLDDRNFKHGRLTNGLLALRFRPSVDMLEAHLAEFLRYEPLRGRRVIVACPDAASLIERAVRQNPPGSLLTPEERRWFVHSTDLKAWNAIQACGELRSFARLQREGQEPVGLGIVELSEPDDYAEYVMLLPPGRISPEHVVASRARGYIFTEEHVAYTPGVRLYFDGWRLCGDGLVVSDGSHPAKVRDHLPLDPYLIASVTVLDIDPECKIAQWTPRTFLDAADAHFRGLVGDQS